MELPAYLKNALPYIIGGVVAGPIGLAAVAAYNATSVATAKASAAPATVPATNAEAQKYQSVASTISPFDDLALFAEKSGDAAQKIATGITDMVKQTAPLLIVGLLLIAAIYYSEKR